MKTFQDRYNLRGDIEAIENYVEGAFRKINRTCKSLHKPRHGIKKAKWDNDEHTRSYSH